jgi:NTE family protein
MGPKQDAGVLGFLIDESIEVPGAPSTTPAAAEPASENSLALGELPAVLRLRGLVDTVTQAHDKMVMEAYNHLVCRLPAKGYGTTEFDMTPERRDALVAAGRAAAAAHFDNPPGGPFAGPLAGSPADRLAAKILSE